MEAEDRSGRSDGVQVRPRCFPLTPLHHCRINSPASPLPFLPSFSPSTRVAARSSQLLLRLSRFGPHRSVQRELENFSCQGASADFDAARRERGGRARWERRGGGRGVRHRGHKEEIDPEVLSLEVSLLKPISGFIAPAPATDRPQLQLLNLLRSYFSGFPRVSRGGGSSSITPRTPRPGGVEDGDGARDRERSEEAHEGEAFRRSANTPYPLRRQTSFQLGGNSGVVCVLVLWWSFVRGGRRARSVGILPSLRNSPACGGPRSPRCRWSCAWRFRLVLAGKT